jgi:hypothetical protein
LITIFLLLLTLDARENPFFPANGDNEILYTSNKDRTLPILNRATIALPTYARVIQKVTIEYKSLDGSVESKSINLHNSIDWHLPIFISQSYAPSSEKKVLKKRKKNYKKVAENSDLKFLISGKTLKIISHDKMIRDFLLVNPHRIVMDFKNKDAMKVLTKKIKNSVFTKIRVGNHAGYYRVVVELDGHYRYRLKKSKGSYLFTLR